MKIIKSPKALQKLTSKYKGKKSIALVPTMGFLHEGHLSLVQLAKRKADIVIVSIYVNEKQFGPKEDFAAYPRDTQRDLALLKKQGADIVFLPSSKDMYPEGFQSTVGISTLSQGLCGGKRPGHFDGVCLVVLKLLNITQADHAIFGKKDFQQLRVIQQMAQDLNLNCRIHAAPIKRARDGLALSSRNSYLNAEQRLMAKEIQQGLKDVKTACLRKALSIEEIRVIFKKALPKNKQVKIDYLELVDAKTLHRQSKAQHKKSLLAAAVFIGKTRLIDNIEL